MRTFLVRFKFNLKDIMVNQEARLCIKIKMLSLK